MPLVVLLPDSDILTEWDTTTGANHFGEIDEDISAAPPGMDTTYIETTTVGDIDEQTMENTPANCSQVTQIVVNIRGQLDDASATAIIRVHVEHSGGTAVAGTPFDVAGADFGGYGVLGTHNKTLPGLTLTKAQADSIQVEEEFLAAP